jgi:hypothetical protein
MISKQAQTSLAKWATNLTPTERRDMVVKYFVYRDTHTDDLSDKAKEMMAWVVGYMLELLRK